MKNLLSYVLLLAAFSSAEALSCTVCNPNLCEDIICPNREHVKDPCGCCDVCAKVLGEECGGPWMTLGRCDKRLSCDKSDGSLAGICVETLNSPACLPTCTMYCRHGNVPDARGCPTCQCNEIPTKVLIKIPTKVPMEIPTCKKNTVVGKHRKACPRIHCKHCHYGHDLDKHGCPTYHCRNHGPQRTSPGCYSTPTVFCTREGRCCLHSSTCNPFPVVYKRDHVMHHCFPHIRI